MKPEADDFLVRTTTATNRWSSGQAQSESSLACPSCKTLWTVLDKQAGPKYQREGVGDLSHLLNFLLARRNERFYTEHMLDRILDLLRDSRPFQFAAHKIRSFNTHIGRKQDTKIVADQACYSQKKTSGKAKYCNSLVKTSGNHFPWKYFHASGQSVPTQSKVKSVV